MTRKEPQKFIFILLLILLPTQLGYHWWPDWAYINGIRVDYFSPTLYLTDIVIFLLFGLQILNSKFEAPNKFKNQKSKASKKKFGKMATIGALAIFVAGNVYFSLSPAVSLYKWIKVLEMGFLAWFVAKNDKLLRSYYQLLLAPIFYESFLAMWQWWQQGSVGGIWYWLGERTFNASTPGIANANINGTLVMRPYGTFSHPNVLGGWVAVVLTHISRKLNARKWWILLVVGLGYGTIFLSLSRVAILVGAAAIWIVLWRRFGLRAVGILGILGVMGVLLAPRFLALGTETEPIASRGQLNSLAMKQFTRSPIWGTGLGTAPLYGESRQEKVGMRNYALMFQPTHNLYLLVLAETGVLGTLVVVGILAVAIKTKSTPLLVILILGLFDHYFLTLQQGQLVLALTVGWSLVRMKGVKN